MIACGCGPCRIRIERGNTRAASRSRCRTPAVQRDVILFPYSPTCSASTGSRLGGGSASARLGSVLPFRATGGRFATTLPADRATQRRSKNDQDVWAEPGVRGPAVERALDADLPGRGLVVLPEGGGVVAIHAEDLGERGDVLRAHAGVARERLWCAGSVPPRSPGWPALSIP